MLKFQIDIPVAEGHKSITCLDEKVVVFTWQPPG